MAETNFQFGIDENTGVKPRLAAGKQENVTLTKIKYEPAKAGSELFVLRFYFEKDGKEFTHTEFPPSPQGAAALAGLRKVPVAQVMKETADQIGERLKHIGMSFAPDRFVKMNIKSSSWADFCQKYLEVVDNAYVGESFRLKIVYNNKGYLSFPTRAISPFIENMKDPNGIVLDPKYDKTEPPTPKDNTESKGNYYPEPSEDEFAPSADFPAVEGQKLDF